MLLLFGDDNCVDGVWSLESGNWNLETGIWSLESGNWNLETGIWILETGVRYTSASDFRLLSSGLLFEVKQSFVQSLKRLLFQVGINEN